MAAFRLRGTILPGGDGPADLWVDAGRLSWSPVAGAESLDLGEAYILPGLVDAHAHLAMDLGAPRTGEAAAAPARNLERHLRAGTLLVRDPGSQDGSTVAWQGRAGVPRVQAASRFLAPEGRYNPGAQWTPAERLAEAASGHAASGAKWVKIVADWPRFDKALGRRVIPANYDAGALRVAVAAAHAAGARVAVHAAGPEGAANAVAAGVDSIEHGDGLTPELLAECAFRGIAWTPTLAMTEALAKLSTRDEAAERAFINDRYDAYRVLLPVAARLGVTILAGTDLLPHGSLAREVDALVRHGLDPKAALAAGSTAARAFFGELALEDGAPADLVVFGADPRRDPGVLALPSLVMLEGVVRHRI